MLGIPVQRKTGPELATGEAFRYLAEIPWAPPAILANRELEWRQLDERTVVVNTRVGGDRIAVRFIFNGTRIEQIVAERPRLEAGGAMTRWIGEYTDYALFNGMRMPARGEVRWEPPEGPFTYWRGMITAAQVYG